MAEKIKGKTPIIMELEPPPCGRWAVEFLDGTQEHEVTMRTDHVLRGEIFECSCGAKHSWSKGCDVGEPCLHIAPIVLALLSQ